jgi:hypothetical protein
MARRRERHCIPAYIRELTGCGDRVGELAELVWLRPGSRRRNSAQVYRNVKVVSADCREVLIAIRPDQESALACMTSLRERLRADPRTADIWDMFVLSSGDGDSYDWLPSHSPPE